MSQLDQRVTNHVARGGCRGTRACACIPLSENAIASRAAAKIIGGEKGGRGKGGRVGERADNNCNNNARGISHAHARSIADARRMRRDAGL